MKNSNKTANYTDFFYYAFRNILLVLVPFLIISVLILSIPRSSANSSSVDNVAITIPSSCTLEGTVNTAHSASLVAGTYTTDIGTTTLKTYCNDANGFTIYAIGAGDNITGNTDLVSSIGEDYNIPTGLNTSKPAEGDDISNWAMKLTAIDGDYRPTIANNYNNYSLVPNTYTNVAYYPAGTDIPNNATTAIGSSVATTYAVYLSSGQPAGTYIGQVKYAILHPHTSSDVITLDLAYQRANKTKYILTTDSRRIPENSPEAEALEPEDILGKYYTMQDMSTTICNNTNITGEASQTQLLDTRDNKTYWATKLDDGNCWMTQNLDLDIDSTKTYTHDDTDLGWDLNNFDVNATWVPDTTKGKYNLSISNNSVPEWGNSSIYPNSADPGNVVYYTSDDSNNDIGTTLENCKLYHDDCEHYQVGNYYNWTAAIASNSSSSYTQNNTDAITSICPAGWRLPKDSINEFGELLASQRIINSPMDISYAANGFSNIRKLPLYLVRSGQIGNQSNKVVLRAGNEGKYLSSTIYSSVQSYFLFFSSSQVDAYYFDTSRGSGDFGYYSRSYGRSVRCLAR